MKRWLYVVQQRLAITNREATALLTISSLIVLGVIAGEVRSRFPVFTDETYATSDRLFLQGSQAAIGGLTWAATDSVEVSTDTANVELQEVAQPLEQVRQPPSMATSPPLIDLNKATAEELQQLPRIGPALAARILEYRSVYGPFEDVAELMDVRGIGEATFARLRPYLTVDPAPANESAGGRSPP